MPELNTAQTNEGKDISIGSGNADTAQNNNTEFDNEASFDDTANYGDGADSKNAEKKVNTKEQNSENARRRREAERKAELERERKTAREQAIIETLGGKNPYTNEEIKDSTDIEEYLSMREIEKNGGDPLVDFSKFHKAKAKEKIAEESEKNKQAEWYAKDREDFLSKHPEVNLETLIQDEQFQLFAEGKVGNRPLSEIYEGFAGLVSEYEKKAKNIAKQTIANSKSSPGALSGTGDNNSGFYSKETVLKMSEKEIKDHYNDILSSMKKW